MGSMFEFKCIFCVLAFYSHLNLQTYGFTYYCWLMCSDLGVSCSISYLIKSRNTQGCHFSSHWWDQTSDKEQSESWKSHFHPQFKTNSMSLWGKAWHREWGVTGLHSQSGSRGECWHSACVRLFTQSGTHGMVPSVCRMGLHTTVNPV